MKPHRTEATVGGDGSVTIRGLPFGEGETVEVIVLPCVASNRPRRRAGSAKGLITVPDDFDEPLEDFKTYM